MITDIGNVTHVYWWQDGDYFRQTLDGGPVEVWSRLFNWAPSAQVTKGPVSRT